MVHAKRSPIAARRNRVSAITWWLNGPAYGLTCALVTLRCLSQRDQEEVPCEIGRTARRGT